jgi:branched-subunit amino acid transport protein
MSALEQAIMVLGMMLVTVAVRWPPLALLSRVRLPAPLTRALRFVPPAVLAAIIAPELFLQEGALALTLSNDYLIAGIVCVLVAWRTRSTLATIILGMIALYAYRALLTVLLPGGGV